MTPVKSVKSLVGFLQNTKLMFTSWMREALISKLDVCRRLTDLGHRGGVACYLFTTSYYCWYHDNSDVTAIYTDKLIKLIVIVKLFSKYSHYIV